MASQAQRDFTFVSEPRLHLTRLFLKQFGYISRPGEDKRGRLFRVHASFCGLPICGGGRDATKATSWQTDIGPCSCRVCLKLMG